MSQSCLAAIDEGKRTGNKRLIDINLAYLRDMTGQDFGNDMDRWEEWVDKYPLFHWDSKSGVPVETQIEEHMAEMKARQNDR